MQKRHASLGQSLDAGVDASIHLLRNGHLGSLHFLAGLLDLPLQVLLSLEELGDVFEVRALCGFP